MKAGSSLRLKSTMTIWNTEWLGVYWAKLKGTSHSPSRPTLPSNTTASALHVSCFYQPLVTVVYHVCGIDDFRPTWGQYRRFNTDQSGRNGSTSHVSTTIPEGVERWLMEYCGSSRWKDSMMKEHKHRSGSRSLSEYDYLNNPFGRHRPFHISCSTSPGVIANRKWPSLRKKRHWLLHRLIGSNFR